MWLVRLVRPGGGEGRGSVGVGETRSSLLTFLCVCAFQDGVCVGVCVQCEVLWYVVCVCVCVCVCFRADYFGVRPARARRVRAL